ncbi:MAG: porin [Gammaproteobacteria bacterium]|nr:porin [Gammaproteobacteria bacterium]
MKKSILAVAVGAALVMAGAAHADVSVYGKAHVSIDSLNNGDESFIYVSSNSSRIGFKASEDLDGGMKLGFLAEQTIAVDGSGTAPTVFDRETYVSFGGGFGTAMVGKIDTPMKSLGRKIDFFGDQIGDTRNLTAQSFSLEGLGFTAGDICTGLTTATTPTLAQCTAAIKVKNVGYDARPSNVIAYTTPDMGGVAATVAFMPEDGTKDGSGFDLAVNYTGGPLFVGFAYESHGKGMNSGLASAGSDESETGFRLGASFTQGDMKVAGMYQSSTDIGGFKDLNTSIIGVGASYKLGAGAVKGQLYKADKYKDSSKTGATMIALGYDHTLSKNTSVYAAFAITNNDDGGMYGISGGWHSANPGVYVDPTSGKSESPSGLSFGVITKF